MPSLSSSCGEPKNCIRKSSTEGILVYNTVSPGAKMEIPTGGRCAAECAASGQLYVTGRDGINDLWWYRATGKQWTNIGSRGIAFGHLAVSPR